MLDRRQFVSSLVSLVILGSTAWRANAAQTEGASPQGGSTRDVFRALVGETFTLSNGNPIGTVTLIAVHEGDPSALTEQFSLVFQRPRDFALLEGVYIVEHPTTGSNDLFLQPRGLDDHHRYYHAPFNLLNGPGDGNVPTARKSMRR